MGAARRGTVIPSVGAWARYAGDNALEAAVVIVERWKTAQEYEAGYWSRQAEAIASGAASQLDWYRWRADELRKWMGALPSEDRIRAGMRVVEVGSGPVGLASFLSEADAILVDPLHDHYGALDALTALRNPAARYLTGRGEALPVETGSADLVVIENCIDHVQDTQGVLDEILRVLRPGGVLYLTVNCRSFLGYFVHRVISSMSLDPGHPHTFTPSRLYDVLSRNHFELLDSRVGSYWQAVSEDLRSGSSRGRLKAVLGVSEYLCSVLARRA
jgi:ubiquinone/menaquinone biosynthesis C-methylase UbiE